MTKQLELNQNILNKLSPDEIAKLTEALGRNRKGFTKVGIASKPPGGGAGNYRETTLPVKPSPSQMEAIDAEFMRREMIKRKLAKEKVSLKGKTFTERLAIKKDANSSPFKYNPYGAAYEKKLMELTRERDRVLNTIRKASTPGQSVSIKNASRLLPPALIASMLQEDDIFLDGDE
tara:strand:- start:28 stop:555 length:528 start_codon:yes stop_codon:yes gene_type:complete